MEQLLKDINKIQIRKEFMDQIITQTIKAEEIAMIEILDKINSECNIKEKSLYSDKQKPCTTFFNKFRDLWSGADYAQITYPVTFYTIHGYRYLELLDNIKKISPELRINIQSEKLYLWHYFYCILMQYIIMSSSKYNTFEYEVYRAINDDSNLLENDEANEYNKQFVLNSLSNRDISIMDNLIENNQIRILCELVEKIEGIDPTDPNITALKYALSLLTIESAVNNNVLWDPDIKKVYPNIKFNTNNVYFTELLKKTNKIIKSDDYKYKIKPKILESINDYLYIKRKLKNLKGVETLFTSYKNGLKNNQYIYHAPFSSFSLNKIKIANRISDKKCCFVTSKLKPHLPYLYVGGLNWAESEVLFPLFSEFKVINSDIKNIQLEYLGSRFQISDAEFTDHLQKFYELEKMNKNYTAFFQKYPEYETKYDKFLQNLEKYHSDIKSGKTVVY